MMVMENYVSQIDANYQVGDDEVWKKYYTVSQFVNQEANAFLPDCVIDYTSNDPRDNVPHSNTYKTAYKHCNDQWLLFQQSIDSYQAILQQDDVQDNKQDGVQDEARKNAMKACRNQWLKAIIA